MKDIVSKKRTRDSIDERSSPTKKCKQDLLESKKENGNVIEFPFISANFRRSSIRNLKEILELPLHADARHLRLSLDSLYQEFLDIYQKKDFSNDSFSRDSSTSELTIAWCDALQNILYYYCHLVKGEGNSARIQKSFEDIKPFIDILLEDPSFLFYYPARGQRQLRIVFDEETNYTALMSLVRIGYYDAVVKLVNDIKNFYLVKSKFNLILNTLMRAKDKDQYSLLHTACKQGNNKIILFLLTLGEETFSEEDHQEFIAFVSTVNQERLSLLTTLCGSNVEATLVKELIEKTRKYFGADNDKFYQFIFHIDYYGVSPLSIACLHGHAELVELLLQYAYQYNDKEYIKGFLSHIDNSGFSPLASACKKGHEKIVSLLVDTGEMAFNDDEGFFEFLSNNPRVTATRKSSEQHLCLNYACKVKDKNIVAILMKVAEKRVHGNCEMALFQNFISSLDSANLSPLTIACNYGNHEAVISLIKYTRKAFSQNRHFLINKVFFPEDDDWSSLNMACIQGNIAIVQVLLEFHTDYFGSMQRSVFQKYLTQKNDRGIAPLHAVCSIGNPLDKSGQFKIVELLFCYAKQTFQSKKELYNEFISTCGTNGTTVLHQATIQANPTLLSLLLQESAEISGKDSREFKRFINARDHKGNTALNSSAYRWTQEKRNRDSFSKIAEILLSYGADPLIENNEGFYPHNNGLYRMMDKSSPKRDSFFPCNKQPIDSISKSTATSMRNLSKPSNCI